MTDRWPATYGPSTITSQPNTRSKKVSRPTVALTPAETRIPGLLATHRTLAAISTQLGAGRPTAKTHIENIYKKLGATTRAGAVTLAESAGLPAPPVTELFSNFEAFTATGEDTPTDAANDGSPPNALMIDCKEMFHVHTTGAAVLTSLLGYARRFHVDVALARVDSDARRIVASEGLIKELARDHVHDTVRRAVEAVTEEPAHTGDG